MKKRTIDKHWIGESAGVRCPYTMPKYKDWKWLPVVTKGD